MSANTLGSSVDQTGRVFRRRGLTVTALLRLLPLLVVPVGQGVTAAEPFRIALPLDCEVGRTCYLQSTPDLDSGSGVADSYCGSASYEGHEGTDIRVPSMKDAMGTAVLAPAAGTVLRARDGEPDVLVETSDARAAVRDRECGNGLVIDHGAGWQTQLCHLARGSLLVQPGEPVDTGDPVGRVGASGLTQFPHVHISVRKEGVELDPATGRPLSEPCADGGAPLWDVDLAGRLAASRTAVIGIGLAAGPVDAASLRAQGPPPSPERDSRATVLWGWAINLEAGDQLMLRLEGPEGPFSDHKGEPLDRSKADYVGYAGRRRQPVPGAWSGTVTIVRDGQPFATRTELFTVR